MNKKKRERTEDPDDYHPKIEVAMKSSVKILLTNDDFCSNDR